MRTALFWSITQWGVLISYHYFLRNSPEERSSLLQSKVTPHKSNLPTENIFIQTKDNPPPKIKHLLSKNILLLVSDTYYTKHIRLYRPLPVSVTVSIFTVSAFPSIASDIQHFLKNFHSHFWSDVLSCHYEPHMTKYYIYISWFIRLLEPIKIDNFLHRWH